MLQQCAACETWQYPPRDVCERCLAAALQWQAPPPDGELLADTTLHTSSNVYFRERTPWRTGSVRLHCGPVIICHVHDDCSVGDTVALTARLDRAGQGVLMALPQPLTQQWEYDAQLRELGCSPRHRRVLITDARATHTPALAEALLNAGATRIFVGESESWRFWRGRDALQRISGIELMPLDVTDTRSVQQLAAEIGGKTDILINNTGFVRDGDALSCKDTHFARMQMDVHYFGLMHLIQAFAPVMQARATDGVNNAIAWVNLLSAYALAPVPEFGCFAAANAAARALLLSLRNTMRSEGIRVTALYTGPDESDWYQPLPPPKMSDALLVRRTIDALQTGVEDVYCGDVASDIHERTRRDAKVLELELATNGKG